MTLKTLVLEPGDTYSIIVRATEEQASPRPLPPLNFPPLKKIKAHRPGTRRAILVAMLKKGAVLEALMKATRWSRDDCREAIRQVHRDLGYGIQESNGKLRLIAK